MKVLIVDDSAIARMSLKKLLNDYDFEYIEGVNGAEAVKLAEEHQLDLIFMDYLMPQLDGMIALKIIRGKGIKTPVIIISANQQDATRQKFLELGIAGMIKKHPDKAALDSLIIELFPSIKKKS